MANLDGTGRIASNVDFDTIEVLLEQILHTLNTMLAVMQEAYDTSLTERDVEE